MNTNQMKLHDLTTTEKDGQVEISVQIKSTKLGQQKLWFSTPQEYANGLCNDRMDGFLVGMLFPAMQYGEDIHISGCVSHKLLFNINNYVIPLLSAFSPSSKRIKVTADETSSERYDVKGVGTGFSAGVDSFCVIYDRLELEDHPDYKINSFLFLNVGSHGWGESADEQAFAQSKFNKRYKYLKEFPEELGLEFIPLDSNLHSFHPWGHQKTHTLTSASGILLMQKLYQRYYYATSGIDYKDMMINAKFYREVDVGVYCDPILLPLLSTESLNLLSEGMQYNRNQKLLHILEYQPVRKFLNVCVSLENSHINCSVCVKCCRTLMTLDSIGRINEFTDLFEIEKYLKKRKRTYVAAQVILEKADPFARLNIPLAKEHGVCLPSYPVALIIVTLHKINGFIMYHLFKFSKMVFTNDTRNKIKKMIKLN